MQSPFDGPMHNEVDLHVGATATVGRRSVETTRRTPVPTVEMKCMTRSGTLVGDWPSPLIPAAALDTSELRKDERGNPRRAF